MTGSRLAIGVVIPARNAQRYLPATLDSVLRQSHQNWQCIVVDDGSDDRTHAVAQSAAGADSRISVLKQARGGASAARNAGCKEVVARGDCDAVAFLDSDDVWRPDALHDLAVALTTAPAAPAVHGLAAYLDAEGTPSDVGVLESWSRCRLQPAGLRLIELPIDAKTSFAALVTRPCLITTGVALVRVEAAAVTPFAETLTHGEDWDWCIRLARLGPLELVDRTVLAYRRHPGNASLAVKHNRHGMRQVRRRSVQAPENTPEQRRAALAGNAAFYRETALQRVRVLPSLRGAKVLLHGGASAAAALTLAAEHSLRAVHSRALRSPRRRGVESGQQL